MTARLSSRHGVGDAMARLRLDRGCALLTPYHRLLGRMLEVCRGAGGGSPNGSTGMGVGVAAVERDHHGSEAGAVLRLAELEAAAGAPDGPANPLRAALQRHSARMLVQAQAIIREFGSLRVGGGGAEGPALMYGERGRMRYTEEASEELQVARAGRRA